MAFILACWYESEGKMCQQTSRCLQRGLSKMSDFNLTHHNGFSLKCFYFFSQVLVRLGGQEKSQTTISDAGFHLNTLDMMKKSWAEYLLSICVRLECDVPVVVVCKLDTYNLWTVVIFEQWLHFLWIEYNAYSLQAYNYVFSALMACQSNGFFCLFFYLNRCGFGNFSQNDNAPLVIRTHFLPFLIHLYHRRR